MSALAIVIELPDHNELCVLEANSRPRCADVEHGTIFPGVRAVPFAPRAETAEGAVAPFAPLSRVKRTR
jgi:hypothetical protein